MKGVVSPEQVQQVSAIAQSFTPISQTSDRSKVEISLPLMQAINLSSARSLRI
jgi:hypothetical protein